MEESGKKCVWLAGRLAGGSEDDVNCLEEYLGEAWSWVHSHTIGRSEKVRRAEAWTRQQVQVQKDRLQYTYTDAVRNSRQAARDRDPTVQFNISDSEAGKKGAEATQGAVATMATIGGGIVSASTLLDEATAGGAARTGSYGELRNSGAKDAHHVIQDAAVRELPGYSRTAAPAVELSGSSTRVGSPHYSATQVQRQAGGGTYAAERRIGYKALRRAGLSEEEARKRIEEADRYFESIGVTPDTVTRVPGNR